jgi:hypothetical protein
MREIKYTSKDTRYHSVIPLSVKESGMGGWEEGGGGEWDTSYS